MRRPAAHASKRRHSRRRHGAYVSLSDWLNVTHTLSSTPACARRSSTRQGRRRDAALRAAIEDLAQERFSAHFRAGGWVVEDLCYDNPFDARATRDDGVVYLEAIGTTTAGESVIVTRGS